MTADRSPAGPGLRSLALTLAALDLALSFAHLMEACPRLAWWPPALWRETTVFHGQYAAFGVLGGPIELAAIGASGWLAWRLRLTSAVGTATAAFALFAAALIVWLAVVAPANVELATWRPGPMPADAEAVRLRWEAGHAAAALIKLVAFVLLAVAATRHAGSDERGVGGGRE